MFDGLAFGIPASDLIDFLVHRDTYLYDSAQPQNGVTYLPPPFHATGASASRPEPAAKPSPDKSKPKQGDT